MPIIPIMSICDTMTVKLCDRVAATFLLIKGVARPSIQMSCSRLHQYSHGSSAGRHGVDSNELILCQIPFPHGVSVIVACRHDQQGPIRMGRAEFLEQGLYDRTQVRVARALIILLWPVPVHELKPTYQSINTSNVWVPIFHLLSSSSQSMSYLTPTILV